MAEKRVLFFDGANMTDLLWKSGHVIQGKKFSADPLGFEAFSTFLANDSANLIYVLTDSGDEGFQLETIPAVQGADRDALIARRLGQFFFGTPFSLGLSLGRNKEGRRDERMLFAALTRPEALTPWLYLIHAAQRALVGVYSIPLVLAESVKQVTTETGRVLLVTLSGSGLRQTYFSDGHMQFSRLSQLAIHSREEFAASSAKETSKTYQYLVGQRQIARNSPLTACILAHPNDLPLLREQCQDNGGVSFQFIDLAALAASSGLKSPLADSHSDPLFAHYLLTRRPKVQFAPAAERKQYRLWQLRSGLRTASVAIALTSLLLGGWFATQWDKLRDETAAINAQAAGDYQRYQSILDRLPKTQLSSANLRAVIASLDAVTRRSPGPMPMLAHLSESLEVMPAITLQRLEWKFVDRKDAGKNAALNVNAEAGVWVEMEVQGLLPIAMASDQRAQIEMVENFATRLRTEDVTVTILNLPIDIESGKTFKRGATDSERPAGAPAFRLSLVKAL